MKRALLLGAITLGLLLIVSFSRDVRPAEAEGPCAGAKAESAEETNPLGANAACYLCHIPFVKEELSREHLKAEVSCIECHGLSAGHANDEDVGATPPEVTFKREQIDAMCRECHESHNVPAREVVARFVERRLSPKSAAVCTDCHGTHKIERPAEEDR